MTDTSVKFFHSDMQGAPALNGLAGSMASLLDAVLTTGFGIRAITGATIAAGVCTVTFTSSIAQDIGSVVLLAGLTPDSGTINGEQKVTASTSTSLSFTTTATGSVAISSATVRTAPLGWAAAFTGTNKRVYKPTAVEASGSVLRLDDTTTNWSIVTGYESMSDVDTGVGPFPSATLVNSWDSSLGGVGVRWYKDVSGTTATIKWILFGDGQSFYLCPAPYNASSVNNTIRHVYSFGDMVPQRSGDTWATVLQGTYSNPNDGNASLAASGLTSYASYCCCTRNYSGVSGATALWRSVPNAQGSQLVSGSPSWYVSFPNPVDNGLLVSPVDYYTGVSSGLGAQLRGRAPGLLHVPQSVTTNFQSNDRVTGNGDFTGKTLMAVRVGNSVSSSAAEPTQGGAVFFDITGPWR